MFTKKTRVKRGGQRAIKTKSKKGEKVIKHWVKKAKKGREKTW
jgi:uridine kinase